MSKKILVVGDILLDVYHYIVTDRKAPESPNLDIYDIVETEYRLGGAANVSHNLKVLYPESNIVMAGLCGNSPQILGMARGIGIETALCFGSTTMTKTRYVDYQTKEHLMRVDNIKKFPKDDIDFFNMNMKCCLWDKKFDMVVISDYDKGTVSNEVLEILQHYENVIVDSKRYDLRPFLHMPLLKLNHLEYSKQINNELYNKFPLESFFNYVVVTKGENGSELRMLDTEFHKKENITPSSVATQKLYTTHINKFEFTEEEKKEMVVSDVCGAGDVSTAALAVGLLKGMSIEDSVEFSNYCARDSVMQFGTSATRFTLEMYKQKKGRISNNEI